MKILFIDDSPQLKAMPIIEYLEEKNIDFSYEISKSIHSAIKYIFTHLDEIDLIVTDLGLPRYEDGYDYNSLNGLEILDELIRKDVSIPVIINSATRTPKLHEYAKIYKKKDRLFSYANSLTGLLLEQYIKKHMN